MLFPSFLAIFIILGNSIVPSILLCEARICSIRVEPDLGSPTMNIGELELSPEPLYLFNLSSVKNNFNLSDKASIALGSYVVLPLLRSLPLL